MRITKINIQQNFKGLWGDTIKINERKNSQKGLVISNYETKIYYPFGDESIENVNNILKENSTYKKILGDGFTKEIGTDNMSRKMCQDCGRTVEEITDAKGDIVGYRCVEETA